MSDLKQLTDAPLGSDGVDWATYRENVVNTFTLMKSFASQAQQREVATRIMELIAHVESVELEDYGPILEAIEANEHASSANKVLFGILSMSTRGRANDVVRTVDSSRDGGFAWLKLKRRFELTGAATYGEVLRFKWDGPFEDRWRLFTLKVAKLPTPMVDGALETLVIEGCRDAGRHALEEALRLRAPQTWANICARVDKYLDTMKFATPGGDPMDVSAIGHAKGRTGGRAEYSGRKGGDGKSGGKGGGKGGPRCWQCNRTGHRSAECRQNAGGGKGQRGHIDKRRPPVCYNCGGTGHLAQNCSSPKPVHAIKAVVQDDVDEWVLAVGAHEGAQGEIQLLVDSGAAVHCCPLWFAKAYGEQVQGPGVSLKSAQGSNIKVHGRARVSLRCQGKQLSISFVVCDVVKPILSVAALQRAGCVVRFGKGGEASIEREGDRVALQKRGELYYLPTTPQQCEHYCIADDDEDGNKNNENENDDIEKMYGGNWGVAACGTATHCAVVSSDKAGEGANEENNDNGDNGNGDNDNGDADGEEAEEEAANVRTRKTPKEPSEEERRQHRITHLPYKSWCTACVIGRGLAAQHRLVKDKEEQAEPVVQFDYGYIEGRTYCAAICTKTNVMIARFVSGKTASAYAVKLFARFVRELGHTRVCLQSDAEKGLMAVLTAVQTELCNGVAESIQSVRLRNTGGFASASNGAVERAHGMIKGHLRTLMHDVTTGALGLLAGHVGSEVCWTPDEEQKHGKESAEKKAVEVTHGVVDWALRHTTWLLNNCHKARKDNKTAYERQTGKAYADEVYPFLSPVIWMDERPDAKRSLEGRQSFGLWMGRMVSTNNHLVLTASGNVVRARTARPLAVSEFEKEMKCSVADVVNKLQMFGIEDAKKEASSSAFAEIRRVMVQPLPKDGVVMEHVAGAAAQEAGGSRSNAKRERSDEQDAQRDEKRNRVGAVIAHDPEEDEWSGDHAADHAVCAVEVPEREVDYGADERWRVAMDAEVDSLGHFKVYEWVDVQDLPAGAKVIGGRWVHTLKQYDLLYYDRNDTDALDKAVYKSRYVAQGFSEKAANTYASTPSAASVRKVLTLAAAQKWVVQTADVSTAFLHAPVDGEVFVEPPPHLKKPGQVWRLKKALYGLRSAPRCWQEHAAGVLADLGWRRLEVDASVYVLRKGKVMGLVVLYVDDILGAGEETVMSEFYKQMAEMVSLKIAKPLSEGQSEQYLGLRIRRIPGGFELDPEQYVEKLLGENELANAAPVATPGVTWQSGRLSDDECVGDDEHRRYRTAVGQLLWLSGIRHDIAYAVKELARKVQCPTSGDVRACKRVLRYLRGASDMRVPLVPSVSGDELVLEAFCDSDWAGCARSRRSTSGGCILLEGCVLSAWSRTQNTVALSSAEAEYVSMTTGATELLWVAHLMSEVGIAVSSPTLWTDSSSAQSLCLKNVSRVKHMELKYFFLKRLVKKGNVLVRKVAGDQNPADILTKPVTRDVLTLHRHVFAK